MKPTTTASAGGASTASTPPGLEGLDDPGAPEDQGARARVEQRGGGRGRGEHVALGGDAHAGELGLLVPQAEGRVVGDEQDALPRRPQPGHGVGGPGQGLVGQPDDAVEVEDPRHGGAVSPTRSGLQNAPLSSALRRPERLLALLRRHPTGVASLAVAAVLLPCYLLTLLAGTGFSGDTAKFQYVGRVLGTPHNTGYPIYTVLDAAIVRLVPLGSVAWRVNLLSALCATAACALLVPVLVTVGCRRLVAAGVALTFGFTVTLWSAAVVAEVYALHVLVLVGLLALLLRWQRDRRELDLAAAVLLTGLALGHHLMIVLALPGVALFVLLVDARAVLRRRVLGAAALGVVLGLGSYAYILWRSASPGPTTYLGSRATNLSELLGVLRGDEFAGDLFAFPWAHIREIRIPNVERYLHEEWAKALLLVPLGFVRRAWTPLTALLLAWAVVDVVFVLNYDVVDVQVFMLPTYLCVAVWVALGLDLLVGRWRVVSGVLVAVALPLVFASWHWHRVDVSKNLPAAHRAEAAVLAVPSGSLLVAPDYQTEQFLLYPLLGEGRATERDVAVVEEDVSARAVARHVRGDGEVPVVGRPSSVGRPAYAVATRTLDELRRLGVRGVPVEDHLWHLVPAD